MAKIVSGASPRCRRRALENGLARRVPLREWPAAKEPNYLGTRSLGGAVAQVWGHELGHLALIWVLPEGIHPNRSRLVEEVTAVEGERLSAVVFVDRDFAGAPIYPSVTGAFPIARSTGQSRATRPEDGSGHRDGFYGITWKEVSRVVSMPLPYSPTLLRRRELIESWTPDAPTVQALATPDLDTGVLLQLAAIYESGTPASRVLTSLSRLAAYRSANDAVQDLEFVSKAADDGQALQVAATPIPVPEDDPRELDPTIRRVGWLDVLSRTDTLAEALWSRL